MLIKPKNKKCSNQGAIKFLIDIATRDVPRRGFSTWTLTLTQCNVYQFTERKRYVRCAWYYVCTCSRHIWRNTFISRLKTCCAVTSWDRTDCRLVEMQEISSRAVPRKNMYLPVVVSFCFRTVTHRSSSRALVSKVTHILSYRRNIVKLLSNTCTFEFVV